MKINPESHELQTGETFLLVNETKVVVFEEEEMLHDFLEAKAEDMGTKYIQKYTIYQVTHEDGVTVMKRMMAKAESFTQTNVVIIDFTY